MEGIQFKVDADRNVIIAGNKVDIFVNLVDNGAKKDAQIQIAFTIPDVKMLNTDPGEQDGVGYFNVVDGKLITSYVPPAFNYIHLTAGNGMDKIISLKMDVDIKGYKVRGAGEDMFFLARLLENLTEHQTLKVIHQLSKKLIDLQ